MGNYGKRDKTRNIIILRQNLNKKMEKKWKNRLGNNKKNQKITRNTETRRDKILARQDFRETRF